MLRKIADNPNFLTKIFPNIDGNFFNNNMRSGYAYAPRKFFDVLR